MSEKSAPKDKFVDMVSAKANVDLPLSDFQPRSSLKVPCHVIERPRFPVIDYHNHLDSQDATDLLHIMDACDIEFLVSITMETGEAGLQQMDRLRTAAPDRFSTIGWMDWAGVERSDFAAVTCDRLERMVEHGACGIKFWKDLGLSVRDGSGALLRIDDERLAPIFDKARELNLPVMFHTADPDAFFRPSIRTTNASRSLQLILTGVFMTRLSRSESCWSKGIASSRATRLQRLLVRT